MLSQSLVSCLDIVRLTVGGDVHAAIPATVVAAASFDDAIAITGYTLFINLAVREGGNTTWSVMHGPLSLVFGLLAGVLAGFMCSITKLWDNSFKRTLVMFFSSAQPFGDPPATPLRLRRALAQRKRAS